MERTQSDGGRPAFQELMGHATSGHDTFDCIIVYDMRTLSHSVTQFEEHRNRLEAHGIRLVPTTEESST